MNDFPIKAEIFFEVERHFRLLALDLAIIDVVRVVHVELVLLDVDGQGQTDEASDFGEEEAVKTGPLEIRINGQDDYIDDGRDESAHSGPAHTIADVGHRKRPQIGAEGALENSAEHVQEGDCGQVHDEKLVLPGIGVQNGQNDDDGEDQNHHDLTADQPELHAELVPEQGVQTHEDGVGHVGRDTQVSLPFLLPLSWRNFLGVVAGVHAV